MMALSEYEEVHHDSDVCWPTPLNKKPKEGELHETARWRLFIFIMFGNLFITILPSFLLSASLDLVEKPLNAAVMVDSDTGSDEFKWKSDDGCRLNWSTNQDQSELISFNGYSICKEAESFCSVENEAHEEFYFELTALHEAAHTYIFHEPDTNKESNVDLIIEGHETQDKATQDIEDNKTTQDIELTVAITVAVAALVVIIILLNLPEGEKKGHRNEEAADVARLKKKPTAPLKKKKKPTETPRLSHFIFSTFVIFNIMFLPVGRCALVEKPLNAAVMVGSDPLEFKCKSDHGYRLRWATHQSQSKLILFDGYLISKEAESFCSVENEAPGEFYLKLRAIREAAQTYICQEPVTNQESSADLIIIEREAQCETVDNNSHVIMKCDLEFHGNWAPELEWSYNGTLITEGVNAPIISNKSVSSTLTVPISGNDRNYTCTTIFDIRGKPHRTTSDNIPDYVSDSVLTVKGHQTNADNHEEQFSAVLPSLDLVIAAAATILGLLLLLSLIIIIIIRRRRRMEEIARILANRHHLSEGEKKKATESRKQQMLVNHSLIA